jgi:hypothetical protein
MQSFGVSGVPADLHAANWDKVPILCLADFLDEPTEFLAFDLRPQNVNNHSVELGTGPISFCLVPRY